MPNLLASILVFVLSYIYKLLQNQYSASGGKKLPEGTYYYYLETKDKKLV